ncbi:MAG: hypothetical protein ACKOSQ_05595 [Planctomycetaceae bacterium]
MTTVGQPSLFSVELRTARWAELVEWYRHVAGGEQRVAVVDDADEHPQADGGSGIVGHPAGLVKGWTA